MTATLILLKNTGHIGNILRKRNKRSIIVKKLLLFVIAAAALSASASYYPPETQVLSFQTCKQTAVIKAALDNAMMNSISTGALLCVCPTNLTVSINAELKGKAENVLFGKVGKCSAKYTTKQQKVVSKIIGKNAKLGLSIHVAGLENHVNPTSVSITSSGVLQSALVEAEMATFTYFFGPSPYVGEFPLVKQGNNYVCKQKIGDIDYNVKLTSKGSLTMKLKAMDEILETSVEIIPD